MRPRRASDRPSDQHHHLGNDRRVARSDCGDDLMADDPLKDAHTAIIAAVAELRAIGVPVPIALHRAAHALAYAIAQRGDCRVLPFNREPPR